MRPEELRESLDFSNISILPSDYSDIRTRKEVDISTKISRNVCIDIPLISSPMDTISDVDMCIEMNNLGAAGILHRFMSIDDQIKKAIEIKSKTGRCYVAIGLKDYKTRVIELLTFESISHDLVDLLFLDTANGSGVQVEEFLKWWNYKSDTSSFKSRTLEDGNGVYTQVTHPPDLIVGNTLSKSSVSRAINLGADGVRHGIGIGSQCTTTIETGIGCPAITALYYGWKSIRNWNLEQFDYFGNAQKQEISLLLDGGIETPGDLVKAIAAGADAVISGKIFAGCRETPGEVISVPDKTSSSINTVPVESPPGSGVFIPVDRYSNYKEYKKYRGMASEGVVEDYGIWDGTDENKFVEGKEELVPYNAKPVKEIVHRFANGLKSAMSYLGYNSLHQLKGSIWTGETIAIKHYN